MLTTLLFVQFPFELFFDLFYHLIGLCEKGCSSTNKFHFGFTFEFFSIFLIVFDICFFNELKVCRLLYLTLKVALAFAGITLSAVLSI